MYRQRLLTRRVLTLVKLHFLKLTMLHAFVQANNATASVKYFEDLVSVILRFHNVSSPIWSRQLSSATRYDNFSTLPFLTAQVMYRLSRSWLSSIIRIKIPVRMRRRCSSAFSWRRKCSWIPRRRLRCYASSGTRSPQVHDQQEVLACSLLLLVPLS
jgi:hypothetical protein